jgi:microcin C transport system ATP-binding protein
MPLLSIDNLSVTFKNSSDKGNTTLTPAVKNLSFTLNKGEVLAIVGESGSGKSVTALSILQLLQYPQAFHPNGSIIFDGKELVNAGEHVLQNIRGNRISMIFQEPMTSLNPLHTIKKQIREPLLIHKATPPSETKQRVIELLKLVELDGLVNRLDAYPHELSGGQRQRVMIAMALAGNPDILIADEPTTALDVTVQAQILKLLKRLQKQLVMSLILITHDLTIVRQIADRVVVMTKGEMVETGTVAEVFSNPQHPYTQKLLASELQEMPPAIPDHQKTIIEAEHVRVSFPIKRNFFGKVEAFTHAVDDVSLSLKEGQTLGIVGESGSGKSTLAMAILRLIKSTGTIVFNDIPLHPLHHKELRTFRKEMQVVFQDPFASLNPRMSVSQIIEEGLKAHKIGKSSKDREDLIDKVLQEVGIDLSMKNRYPHEFSGGQRQRISIARALVLQPKFIVLDEPTSALDLTVQKQIIELLRNLQKQYNLSLVFISHDLRVIRAISHHILVMRSGKIVEYGETHEIFTNPKEPYTKALLDAAFNPPSVDE